MYEGERLTTTASALSIASWRRPSKIRWDRISWRLPRAKAC